MGAPVYTCENEDCEDEGVPYVPDHDEEAVCPTCGWMLVGIGNEESDLVG